jgi:hypothetical protein
MSPPDAAARWHASRRPGTVLLVLVLALHAVLIAALWRTLHSRRVDVPQERHSVLWITAAAPLAAPALPPAALPRGAATKPERARPAPPADAPLPPHESTWVQPAAVAEAAPPAASAASAPPERLLDSAATRLALRQLARQPLLHERAAAATDDPIRRSDTALAQGVAEAGLADCLKDGVPGGILGIPLLAVQVARGKCAK